MNAKITSTVVIKSDTCYVNGEKVFKIDSSSEDGWFKQIYRFIQPEYPKFYKMDQLSQAAFLAVELLKIYGKTDITSLHDEEVAMLFANRETSSVTDALFIDSYENNGSPSPSLFVYTLPNILLGELSIRNKWYGENIFTVFPKFALGFYEMNATVLLDDSAAMVLCGWINVTQNQQEIVIFTIEDELSSPEWNQSQLDLSGFSPEK